MTPLTRRDLLRTGAAGAAGLAVGGAGYWLLDSTGDGEGGRGRGGGDARNVVVVVIDNLRVDHVGAYGDTRVLTPNLDALAADGLRFTRARPEAFPTVAARRAILTGRRSFPFRDWHAEPEFPQGPSWSRIDPARPTFLQILARAGYDTGYVTDNPWILSEPFDRFRSTAGRVKTVRGQVPARDGPMRNVSDAELRTKVLPAQRGQPVEGRIRDFLAVTPPGRREDEYPAAQVFAQASRWVERSPRGKPFALVVDAFTPHEPFDPPPAFAAMYGNREPDGPEPVQPFSPPIGTLKAAGIDDSVLARIKELYAAEVTFTDRWLGNFLDGLDAAGLSESTHVVLLSDHGMLLGEHGYVGKKGSQTYDEVMAVPFVIRHADGAGAGATDPYFASTHDVAPTVLGMLGLEAPGAMEGEDLSAALEGGRLAPRPIFTAGYDDVVLAGDGRYLLRAEDRGAVKRLYDSGSDPEQDEDVSGANPQVTAALWAAVLEAAGGTLPRFGKSGVISG